MVTTMVESHELVRDLWTDSVNAIPRSANARARRLAVFEVRMLRSFRSTGCEAYPSISELLRSEVTGMGF